MESTPLFSRIDTVIVRVRDVASARAWYQEKLGFTSVYDDEGERLTVLNTGGQTSLTLWQIKPGEHLFSNGSSGAFPIFAVEDAAHAHQTLVDRRVDVGPLPNGVGVCYFQFRDPDGNSLEACQVL